MSHRSIPFPRRSIADLLSSCWEFSVFRKGALIVAAASLMALPSFAAPQAPANPAPPQQPPAQTAPQAEPQSSPEATQPTTEAQKESSKSNSKKKQSKTEAQSQSPSEAKAKPADQPVPQQENPNVKKGSEADVDAIGNRDVGKGVNFYSLEKEIAMGKGAAQEVERSAKLINDPIITEYVNRVGQNLVRNSDAKVPFTIKVIDSDQINAMALPGGFFYVNSGLIMAADSEAELAGVMAHEIAHVAARHGTRNQTKGNIAQLATIPLIMLGPGGWAGYGLYEGLQFAVPISFLKFSRDDEREADYLGTQYMYKAGYDPNAMVQMFEKIEAVEKRQPGSVPKIFSTHPPTPERVQNIQKEIGGVLPARDEYIVTTSEFDTVKARLEGIEHHVKLLDSKDKSGKPTLRTRTEQQPSAQSGNGQQQPADPSEDPDRPTLHRRDDPDQNP